MTHLGCFGHVCVCKNSRVAQGCLLDNQAKFVIIYHKSTNHLKKFIGKDISRLKKLLLDYSRKVNWKFVLVCGAVRYRENYLKTRRFLTGARN